MGNLLYFFPVQLIIHLIKKNIALLLLWVLLLAMVLGGIGRIYGIHYLFLDPEYLNEVSPLSFFLVGLAFGNFVMAFHITSYILDAQHFSFVAVLEKPFTKYTLNNSVVPFSAFLVYIISIVLFQLSNDFASSSEIFLFVMAFTLGVAIMMILMFLYFRWTNTDIFKYLAGSVDKRLRKSSLSRERVMDKLKEGRQNKYPVNTYLDLKFKVRSCKNFNDFYDKESLIKVFDQNHFNSVLFELIVILGIFSMGIFLENPLVQIPAAASTILLFSILMMFIGALSYWFRSWAILLVIVMFLAANLVARSGLTGSISMARGMNYDLPPVDYSLNTLNDVFQSENFESDKNKMLGRLENWKKNQTDSLPKIVLFCVSGGGQRSALWTLHTLINADSVIGGGLAKKTALITGASGGMIGAAYFRELSLQRDNQSNDEYNPNLWRERMGKDNLNHVIFSMLVNDLFFKIQSYTFENKKYVLDRGYIFEQNLNNNLNGAFDKKLIDYRQAEDEGRIPSIILSPIIANDGRKLFISTIPVSFMMGSDPSDQKLKLRGIDFHRFFANHDPQNLHFTTALRMSASFPYITPVISLPSHPRMEIMDAGISDNFGVADALHFIYVFREWVEKNTSGIVLVQIRDTEKNSPIAPRPPKSIVDRLSNPISSVYNNLSNIQDINNDSRLAYLKQDLAVPLDLISFEYDTYSHIENIPFESESNQLQNNTIKRASLSWHLTSNEKVNILQHGKTHNNQQELKRLKSLLSK